MIATIKMRNCATYDTEGASISNCKKVNFVYGPNGSGKSTISNFLQTPSAPYYVDSEVIWSDESRQEIVVYNRKFREQNFSNSNIAGVFTLGHATIEDLHNLERLKEKLALREKEYIGHGNTYRIKEEAERKCRNDFRDTIWNVLLKVHEEYFQDAFSGFRNSKERFLDEVLRRFSKELDSPYSLSELQARSKTLFSSKPEPCPLIDVPVLTYLSTLTEIENNPIWQKIIVGNNDVPIGKLIQKLNNLDWVNQGRSFISGNICPFCQQDTITPLFLEQLSQFFDEEYETDTSLIQSLSIGYTNAAQNLTSLFGPVLNNTKTISLGFLNIEIFRAKINLLDAQLQENISLFRQKEQEPSRNLSPKPTSTIVGELYELIKSVNERIEEHNLLVDNYNTEKAKLADDIWEYLLCEQAALVSGYLSDLYNFQKAKNAIVAKQKSLKKEIESLNAEIIEANSSITSVQPTVDEINRLLKAYGFYNFEIVPSREKENYYQIQRPDGTLASNTLSEGEETFISFLYFMQLAKGAIDLSKISSRRILVLDDPICSLDSTILYIVSAIVKDLIAEMRSGHSDVEQIFVFTHNVFFHKEVSFKNGRTDTQADVNYWIIHKDSIISKIISYGQNNPISTSYELLWRELRDSISLSSITIQNTMRRILENYFGMLGNKKYDSIANQFSTAEEKIICESLFYWVNDGSHTIPDDLYIDSYSGSIEKYKEVFHQIFVITKHEAHYNMMMGITET